MTCDDVIRDLAVAMVDHWEPLPTRSCRLHCRWKYDCPHCAPELDEHVWVHGDYYRERAIPFTATVSDADCPEAEKEN